MNDASVSPEASGAARPSVDQPPVMFTPTASGQRRWSVIAKLGFIAALVLVLHVPLHLVSRLMEERRALRGGVTTSEVTNRDVRPRAEDMETARPVTWPATPIFDMYRMVERALKYGALVLALVFTAFFLFEALAGVRLHAVHYGLVGAAMVLFYLALLALGEVIPPGAAYATAAGASSLLIVMYSAAILRSRTRAAVVALLLGAVHGVLFIVLRMESYALLAGTGALFAALGAVMWFTRHVDWHAEDLTPVARRA